MLFDLRSGKRRRLVQVVYTLLAASFIIGFVIFGVGSNGIGGIGDLISGGGDDSAVPGLPVPDADRRCRDDAEEGPAGPGGADRAGQPPLPGGRRRGGRRQHDGPDQSLRRDAQRVEPGPGCLGAVPEARSVEGPAEHGRPDARRLPGPEPARHPGRDRDAEVDHRPRPRTPATTRRSPTSTT